jgi:hypothetical protein
MLQSYEAVYEKNCLRWIDEKPDIDQAHVIVTILPSFKHISAPSSRRPSPRIAGKGKILGDIMTPLSENDWDALK